MAGVAALAIILAMSAVTFVRAWNSPGAPPSAAVISINAVAATAAGELRDVSPWEKFTGYFETHFPLLAALWFMGVMFLTLRLAGGFLLNQRLKSYRVQSATEEIRARFERLARLAGIRGVLKLSASLYVKSPVTIGHFKPVVLFPVSMMSGLPLDQVEALLAHELAHIVRRDYLVNILQSLVDIVFFYHPAVRWVSGFVRTEREHCCDDLAVSMSGDRLNYARALASLEESFKRAGHHRVWQTAAVAAAGHRSRLLNRIRRLVTPLQGKKSFEFSGGMAAVLLFVALFVFGYSADALAGSKNEKPRKPLPPKAAPMAISGSGFSSVPSSPPAAVGPVIPAAPLKRSAGSAPTTLPLPEAPEDAAAPSAVTEVASATGEADEPVPAPVIAASAENSDVHTSGVPEPAQAPEPPTISSSEPATAPEPHNTGDIPGLEKSENEDDANKDKKDAMKKMQEKLRQMELKLAEKEKQLALQESILKKKQTEIELFNQKINQQTELERKRLEELNKKQELHLQQQQEKIQQFQKNHAEQLSRTEQMKREIDLKLKKVFEDQEKLSQIRAEALQEAKKNLEEHDVLNAVKEAEAERLMEKEKEKAEKLLILQEKELQQLLQEQKEKQRALQLSAKSAGHVAPEVETIAAGIIGLLKQQGVLDNSEKYQVTLSAAALTVNGVRQPDKNHEICLKKYAELAGKELNSILNLISE